MRILGIDQSSCTGWAVLDDDKLFAYGLIDLTECNSKRLLAFSQNIVQIVDKYKPDIVGWENLKSNMNPDTIRQLGEYTGILRMLAEENGWEYREPVVVSIRAKVVKFKGTGNRGRKTKLDLAKQIEKDYNIERPLKKAGPDKGNPITDEHHKYFNQTDAIGIAKYIYLTEG